MRCKRGVEGRRKREEQKPKSWMQLEFSDEGRDLKKGEEGYVGWRERERERGFDMRSIKLPEPPGSVTGMPEIFDRGISCVVRRAVIIGNGAAGAENQCIGVVRALGLSGNCTIHVRKSLEKITLPLISCVFWVSGSHVCRPTGIRVRVTLMGVKVVIELSDLLWNRIRAEYLLITKSWIFRKCLELCNLCCYSETKGLEMVLSELQS